MEVNDIDNIIEIERPALEFVWIKQDETHKEEQYIKCTNCDNGKMVFPPSSWTGPSIEPLFRGRPRFVKCLNCGHVITKIDWSKAPKPRRLPLSLM